MLHLSTAIMLTAAYHQGLEGGHWTVRMPAVAELALARLSSRECEDAPDVGPGMTSRWCSDESPHPR
jgi:hypothetical protein